MRFIEALSWVAVGPGAAGRPGVRDVKVAARWIAGTIPSI
jgi:hypothetical protein